MSRSVKKSPVCNDHNTPGTRWAKRQASKAVRRFADDVQNGKWYRRLYNPWNICDYRFYQTKQQAINEWNNPRWRRHREHTLAEAINYWAKFFQRK